MNKKIDLDEIRNSDQNFCRVFELPHDYPSGFCFGGGYPVEFQMVDWFNPIPQDGSFSGDQITTWGDCVVGLTEFLQVKRYVRPGRHYLVITDFGEAFVFAGKA